MEICAGRCCNSGDVPIIQTSSLDNTGRHKGEWIHVNMILCVIKCTLHNVVDSDIYVYVYTCFKHRYMIYIYIYLDTYIWSFCK